ncbi:unnamed protein product [Leuciscus chuanchicus]
MDLAAANKKRARLPGGGRKKVSEELDTKLSEWIHSMRDNHNRVSRKMIRNKALEIYPTPCAAGREALTAAHLREEENRRAAEHEDDEEELYNNELVVEAGASDEEITGRDEEEEETEEEEED